MTAFFNEFHYDNSGTDSNEKIEIAFTAGTDLTGWKVYLYNGGSTAAQAAMNPPMLVAGVGSAVMDMMTPERCRVICRATARAVRSATTRAGAGSRVPRAS